MIIKRDLDRMAEDLGHPGGGLKTMLDAMEAPSHARHLLLQLNSQRTKGFLCDVIIVVQNALFRAHKNILAASSIYLKSLVVHDNLINLDHEMVSPGIFRIILDYIYTGRLSDGDQASEQNLGAVLAAASYLQLLDLVALCKKKLKRNGKYSHIRAASFSPYGKVGQGAVGRYRASTPVIQSCFPGGVISHPSARPHLEISPVESLLPHPLATHTGELYAPPSQGSQLYPPLQPPPSQPGLRPSERGCSPLHGLDLSKKSPSSQSQQAPPHHAPPHARLHPDGVLHEPPPLPGGRDSPPLLGANGGSYPGREPGFASKTEADRSPGPLAHPHPHINQHLHPHAHPHPSANSHGQDPFPAPPGSPGAAPPGEAAERARENSGGGAVYRWMKHEPLAYPAEDEEEDEEEEDEEERGKEALNGKGGEDKLGAAGGGGAGYPLGCDGEDDKSGTSEDTGSSEGRSPGGALERFHMAYEPESFGDNLYVCIPCDKGFPSSEQLNAHVEAHTEEELFSGSAGELGLSNSGGHAAGGGPGGANNGLGGHPYLDSKPGPGLVGEIIRPYRCSSCEKSYKDPATLRQHEKTHWLTRPYPCSICGKKFTQRGTMTRHMRSHLGLKPFACDACGMRFTRQYRLTEHMRIHSGEKPYECQVCGGKFAQQRNLISHMKMHSAGTPTGVAPDGKLKIDFPAEGLFPLSKYAAEHLGLKQEKASELLAQASQHLLADPKAIESLFPLSKLAAEHLGLAHDKMEALGQPPAQPHPGEVRSIDRYSPS
ncbi:hypermethylated in cancer 1 protein isoform X2 [Lepisosteus oculatus]|uniref:hypermethylated in cancer 1 protein isoform X2 n=1 Tax=Lepisosteus oculatus TaxID=7918 RepID=UPI003712C80E